MISLTSLIYWRLGVERFKLSISLLETLQNSLYLKHDSQNNKTNTNSLTPTMSPKAKWLKKKLLRYWWTGSNPKQNPYRGSKFESIYYNILQSRSFWIDAFPNPWYHLSYLQFYIAYEEFLIIMYNYIYFLGQELGLEILCIEAVEMQIRDNY